ncbi:MAG: preprotein translocase subunit YajC [Deltaproteobacteria bacterium]|nr:preprotein translocase subunit YajC [Deltaproteobacteria bacterium]
MWTTLGFFGVMILVFWLLIIRPQSKQRKKQEEFLKALSPGDKVLTASGLIGRIVVIEGEVVTLEIAKDVRVRMVKGHVSGKYTEGETKAS